MSALAYPLIRYGGYARVTCLREVFIVRLFNDLNKICF